MRRVEIAPSFDRDAEDIGVYIEQRFGVGAREQFVSDLAHMCALLALFPTMGKMRHGYDTQLLGFAFHHDWVFFDFDDETVQLLHIVDTRRDKPDVAFDR